MPLGCVSSINWLGFFFSISIAAGQNSTVNATIEEQIETTWFTLLPHWWTQWYLILWNRWFVAIIYAWTNKINLCSQIQLNLVERKINVWCFWLMAKFAWSHKSKSNQLEMRAYEKLKWFIRNSAPNFVFSRMPSKSIEAIAFLLYLIICLASPKPIEKCQKWISHMFGYWRVEKLAGIWVQTVQAIDAFVAFKPQCSLIVRCVQLFHVFLLQQTTTKAKTTTCAGRDAVRQLCDLNLWCVCAVWLCD